MLQAQTIKKAVPNPIRFKATPFKIGSWTLILLPKDVSAQLPSRGMTMVAGTLNGSPFQTPLEPDGRGSHWFRLDQTLRQAASADANDIVTVQIKPIKEWPEPVLPADIQAALTADKQARDLWLDITPMARWDWLRWISSTGKSETRQRRISVALSKLKAGLRRPCCFNRTMCTEPSVSKNGVLLVPSAR